MIVDFYHNNKRIIIETHWYSSKYHLDQQIVISRRLLTCNNVLDVIQDPDVLYMIESTFGHKMIHQLMDTFDDRVTFERTINTIDSEL